MKKKILTSVVSLLLVVSMSVSIVPSASAVAVEPAAILAAAILAGVDWVVHKGLDWAEKGAAMLRDAWFPDIPDYTQHMMSSFYAKINVNTGQNLNVFSYDACENAALMCSTTIMQETGSDLGLFFCVAPINDQYCGIKLVNSVGEWFLKDTAGNLIVCENPAFGSVPSVDLDATIWQGISSLSGTTYYRMFSLEDLYNLANDNDGELYQSDGMFFVVDHAADPTQVLTNTVGRPVAAFAPGTAAVDTERITTSVVNDNSTTNNYNGNKVSLDIGAGAINTVDGNQFVADSIIYDSSSHVYHVDSHDTYNNYYTYNYEYHINYTSITYIGTTAEYNEVYDAYYLLPDGRDSADLTREELEQLTLSLDVINYDKATDDARIKALFHFDGDTRDSSFYEASFEWDSGASITYMDSGIFDGCLYLDETAHDFTVDLVDDLGTSDFTVQFRYYSSYTASPQEDSYVYIGRIPVLCISGSELFSCYASSTYSPRGKDLLTSLPVGTWNEIAIMRHGGSLYYYLNGVGIGSESYARESGSSNQWWSSYEATSEIRFAFGDDQQTYKQIDELRVLSFALVDGLSTAPVSYPPYTPTAVPYDSNVAYILRSLDVMREEYPTFEYIYDEYFRLNFTSDYYYSADYTEEDLFEDIALERWTGYSSAERTSDGVTFTTNPQYTLRFFFPDGESPGYYRVSIITPDCSVHEVYYSVSSSGQFSTIPGKPSDIDFNAHTALHVSDSSYVYFSQTSAFPLTISGVEVSHYSSLSELEAADHVTADIVSVAVGTRDLPHNYVLAVRSSVPVSSYQIGGVRPSVPTTGTVYALVESGYITSLQIYNGRAWENVDGRIYTGTRWIPFSSFNVVTLSDMYDIVDASGQSGYEYIYTETGFWAWFQRQWLDFRAWLESVVSKLSSADSAQLDDTQDRLDALAPDASDTTITEVVDTGVGSFWKMLQSFFEMFSSIFEHFGESVDELSSAMDEDNSSGAFSILLVEESDLT